MATLAYHAAELLLGLGNAREFGDADCKKGSNCKELSCLNVLRVNEQFEPTKVAWERYMR